MNTQNHIKRTVLHAALFAAAIGCSMMAQAQSGVTFKGRIVHTDSNQPVSMIVTKGSDTLDVMVRRNGRYVFTVPANDSVSVTFTSQEHIAKQIIVDTHGAPLATRLPVAGRVAFHVELERADATDLVSYAGPVGLVHFVEENGRSRKQLVVTPQQKVRTEQQLVTAAR